MANVTGVQGQDAEWQSNGALAYALFRFTFGLNIMLRGVVRIALGQAAFQAYMLKQFENVQRMMKKVSKKGGLQALMRGMRGQMPPGGMPPFR